VGTALGAFIAGVVVSPSDFMRPSTLRPGRAPVRGEVTLVLVLAALGVLVGGVAGWYFLAHHWGGAVLGVLVGLVGSMIPGALGSRLLRRAQSRTAGEHHPQITKDS
jgi:hypothetical protein